MIPGNRLVFQAMLFPSNFWNACQYRLRSVMTGEDIARTEGWSRHRHPFWVIDTWGTSRGWIRVAGKIYRREPNSIALYAPRKLYEEKYDSGDLLSWGWMLLEEADGDHSPLQKLTGADGFALMEDPTGQIRKAIEELFETSSKITPGRAFLLAAHVNLVIGMLLNLGTPSHPKSETEKKHHKQWVHPWKRAARIELERTFPKSLTVQKLAAALNIAPSTLTHKYRSLCGESFKDTVNHWRLEKALVLLKKADISIKEICTELGFSHPSYLTSFLKKATGHPPSELRLLLNRQK